MSHEVWKEIYDRLVELIESHRTTLIMVNTRRLAERMAHQLTERLGAEYVAAHHGSLSKETRLDAEERLREGKLKVLVATASLELGIDIGHVDLVCQISSPQPHRDAAAARGPLGPHRARAAEGARLPAHARRPHRVRGDGARGARRRARPRHRARQAARRARAADRRRDRPREEWDEDGALRAHARRLSVSQSRRARSSTKSSRCSRTATRRKRGRRGALIHHDAVNDKMRARKGSRMTAIMSGGAIPGSVRLPRAARARRHVHRHAERGLRDRIAAGRRLPARQHLVAHPAHRQRRGARRRRAGPAAVDAVLARRSAGAQRRSERGGVAAARGGRCAAAGPGRAAQATTSSSARSRGSIERLRPARARPRSRSPTTSAKASARSASCRPPTRSCSSASSTSPAACSSCCTRRSAAASTARGASRCARSSARASTSSCRRRRPRRASSSRSAPSHSFPLEDVFRYLHPNTVRETLIQAVLDSPIFETRWRWTTTLALAVPRNRGGARVPAQLQRMYAEDLLQGVFPDATRASTTSRARARCRTIRWSTRRCAMRSTKRWICRRLVADPPAHRRAARSTASRARRPSLRCSATSSLNSAVYTFLDDAPLEERRTQAVYTRRATEPRSADDLGALDPAAIERVREEAWPYANTADELHDALLLAGFIARTKCARSMAGALASSCAAALRAGRLGRRRALRRVERGDAQANAP